MKIDIHCHVAGNSRDINNVDNDVYFLAEDNQHWFTRILYNLLEKEMEKLEADLNKDGMISTDEYFNLIYNLLCQSNEIDGIVLLALDAVFSSKTGKLNKKETDLWISNRFLFKKVKELNYRLQSEEHPDLREKRFFFGASVSPNRKDWKDELSFVINETDAVLIKLIPSAQQINLMKNEHAEFYKTLALNNMPLLCHVGPEYSFPEGIRNMHLDHFENLRKALDYGVTVIAAHCASPVFPVIDRNFIQDFFQMMKDYNRGNNIRLWADTSALSLSSRIPYIKEIRKTFPAKWLVHGTDFPIPIDGWTHLPYITDNITPSEYIDIVRTKNPFDRDIKIKRCHGFSDSILENAAKVLRINNVK
jgi:predicted TIM-barrel fold metal-dependent hydrolase